MAQKIMIDMTFQANVSQAKAKMQELQKQLTAIQNVTNRDLPMNQLSSGLEQAKNAAAQLSVQLRSAFNQDTGRLDLSRFNQQLKQSGMNLEKYKAALMQAGPAGQQAFGQLAMQIASADTHVIRINSSLKRLGTTFANTFRYQLSASVITTITSAISQAYSYAQDLNESLNDIRIVTGYSAERMEDFAKAANKAAKALSATTTEYTKASLIYFQQGLGDKQVKERTDLTIKMANVTGQSVEQVSEQLTAVWNNFDDGTKPLERYVDVMVALGAATASSSEEISEGLNKFAAVAETVGLSYEYAASALATVTATTRQSADVVGTAFKTLFARIQDLELGETLDDGTTLGQYSQALAAVGISIKDSNGQLKDMDNILNEMGSKWNTLSKDSQVALAQNVAGVRQYTQLIALMDNWDFFQENLNTANTSTGALQEQANIYAESWEAAQDRVTASLEAIYDALLDDKAFISILNFFADFLDNINKVIESVGGLRGVILLLSTALLNLGRDSITSAMASMGTMAMSLTKAGRQKLMDQRDTAFKEATSLYDDSTATGKAQNEQIRNKVQLEREYYELSQNATAEQKEILAIRKQQLETQIQQTEQEIESLNVAERTAAASKLQANKILKNNYDKETFNNLGTQARQAGATQSLMQDVSLENEVYAVGLQGYNSGKLDDMSLNDASNATNDIIDKMERLKFGSQEAEQQLRNMFGDEGYEALNNYYQKVVQLSQEIEKLKSQPLKERSIDDKEELAEKDRQARMREIENDPNTKKTKSGQVNKSTKVGKEYADLQKASSNYSKGLKTQSDASVRAQKASEELNTSLAKQNEAIDNTKKSIPGLDKKVEDMSASERRAAEATDNFIEANKNVGVQAEQTANQLGEGSKAADRLDKTFKDSVGPVSVSQKLTNLASAAMSAAMAIQAIQSLGNIWSDEDASLGDKILQTMMTLGMVIPMVTSAFSAKNVQQMLGITITAADNVVTVTSTGGKLANAIATWAQKHATDALNASMLVSLGYFALILVAVAAVIAIVVLLVNAFQAEKTAAEKAAEAHKANEEALAAMNERLDEAKTKLQEVKDLLSSYDEVSNAFDKLVEGSTEWNENLAKHQEILAQLLEQYPELVDMDIIGFENGMYTVLDEAAMRQYTQGQATIEMLKAQMGQTNASNRSKESAELSQYTKNIEDLNNNVSNTISYYGSDSDTGYIFNTKTGQQINFSPGAASAASTIGAQMEQLLGDHNKYYSTDEIKSKLIDSLGNYYTTNSATGEMVLLDNAAIVDEVLNSGIYDDFLKEYEEINKEHIANQEKINKQQEAAWKVTAQTLISSLEGYSSMTDLQKEAATALMAKQLEQAYDSLALDNYRVGLGLELWEGAYGGGNGDNKESKDRYHEFVDNLEEAVYGEKKSGTDSGWSMGEDTAHNFQHSQLGKDALEKYAEDVLGQDLATMGSKEYGATKVKIGDTEIEYAKVLQYYADELALARLDLQKGFEDVKNLTNAQAAGISMDYLALTKDEMDKIGQETEEGGYELDRAYIDEMYALLETQGIIGEKAEAYIKDMENAAAKYDAQVAETLRLQADLQKGNALIATEAEKYDLDTETLERYAETLKETGNISYETAAKIAIANAKMSKGVKGLQDKLNDVLDTLKNYDKNTYEFAEAAAEIAESLELMFGAKVSNSLIDEWAKNGTLEKLAAGGQEAVETFEDLRLAVSKDYVASLSIDEGYKTQFVDLLTQLNDLADNADVGTTFDLDGHPAIETMNTLLAEGKLTEEQLQSMFDGIDWSPELDYVDYVQDPASVNIQALSNHGSWGDAENGINGTNLTYQRIETKSITKVPQLKTKKATGKSGKATYQGVSGTASLKTPPSGGPGSKSKKKDKNTEVERYHEITQKLEDLNREYDKLGKLKDRAFGQSHLDYLDLESKKLDELIEGEKEYVKQIEANLALDKEALSKYGVSFDESGRITNYDEVYAAQIAQYNTNPEAYEESYSAFTEAMGQYEESLNLLEDTEEDLFDKQNERFDKALEKAEYTVEYGTSLVEDSLAIIDYQLEKIEDDAYKTAEALALIGQKMSETAKNSATYTTGIETTLGASGLSIDDITNATPEELAELVANGTFTAEQVELLREYRDGLLDTNREMKEMADEALDKLIDHFDTWNEKIQENTDNISHLRDMTQSYRDIIDLVGKDTLGVSDELLERMNDFTVAASQQQVAIAKQQLEANKASLAQAKDRLNEAASEEEKKYWQEVVDNFEKTVQENEANLLAATQESLQAIQDAFSDTLKRISDEFGKTVAGMAGSLEALQNSYDMRQKASERYVADYAKIYELSKLTRDINKSMDETDSIRGKKQLLDLQEEINALQESGVEMTQFEVDELRARYDLKLAEIALEEAQNAKNQVRMSRDAEGNWGYVYTADQSKIDSAQQSYEDKLYAYQNLTNEYMNELESQMLALPGEWRDALLAIWEDTTLDEEEKEARAKEVNDFYAAQSEYLTTQMGKTNEKTKALYDNDWKNYSLATGYKISADEDWRDSFNETTLSQITGYQTLEEYQTSVASAAQTMSSKVSTAYSKMQSDMAKTLDEAGLSVENFASDLTAVMNDYTNTQLPKFRQEANKQIKEMGTTTKDAFKEAGEAWKQYAEYVATSATANEALATAINKLISAIGNIQVDTAPLDNLSQKWAAVAASARAALEAQQEAGGYQVNDGPTSISASMKQVQEDKYTGNISVTGKGVITYNGEQYLPISLGGHTYYIKQSEFEKNSELLHGSSQGGVYSLNGVNLFDYTTEDTAQARIKYKAYYYSPVSRQNKYTKAYNTAMEAKTAAKNMMEEEKNDTKIWLTEQAWNQYWGQKTPEIKTMETFKTGGYTGEWDSSGRLAMLHQKELVLNAHDTENFLAGITVLRNIVSMIDLQAAAQQYRLDSLSHIAATAPVAQTLQQDVTIHAEFPNAKDRYEIEEAIYSLMNRASQVANRKN